MPDTHVLHFEGSLMTLQVKQEEAQASQAQVAELVDVPAGQVDPQVESGRL